MRVIVVGGTSSGVGKTSLVRRLLEVLPGWGALKTSPHHGEGELEIVRDEATLRQPGSDTSRYLHGGASRVAWLRYRPEHLERGMVEALSIFEDCPGVVIEGNSAARCVSPALVIVVARSGSLEVKESARELLARADHVVLNRVPPWSGMSPADLGDVPEWRIAELDVEDDGDDDAEAFLESVLTWSRRPA